MDRITTDMKIKNLLLTIAFLGVFLANAQTADFSATPTTICVGQSVQFTNLSSSATSYAWTFPDGGAGQTSILTSPSITYSNPGTYSVTLVATGASSDTETKSAFITVLSAATATLTSAAGSDNQSLCLGSFLNQIVYSTYGATGADFSGLPAFMTGTYIPPSSGNGPGTITVSGSPSAAGLYPYSLTTTGPNCTPITVSGTVSASDNTSLTNSAGPTNQLVCVSTPLINIDFTVGGSPTSVTVTGLPVGVTGLLTGSTFTISGTPTSVGGYAYTITATGGPCPQVQFSGAIQVEPDIQLNTAPGTINQTLCVNTPLGNIVYGLGPSITGASASGLPAGVQGNFSSGQFVISFSPSVVGVFNYTVTTTGGSCGPATATGSITVQAPATIALDVPGSNTQSLCQGTPIMPISYTIGGGGTGGTVTGLPTGVTGTFNSGVFTISGSPSQSGTFNYTVSTTGTACGPETLSGTLTVSASPQLILVSAAGTDSQTVCNNSSIISIIYFVTVPGTTISVINLPPGVTSITQNDSLIISGSPSALGTHPFTVSTPAGACPPDSSFGQIIASTAPVLTLSSAASTANQSMCSSQAITTIVYTISGAADTAFVSGLPTGVSSQFSGDSLIITGTPTALGTANFIVTASGGLCPNVTLSGSIYVGNPQITLVSPASTSTQQLCLNVAITPIIYVFSGGATGATTINLPAGLSLVSQNDSIIISGTPTVIGMFPFTAHTIGTSCQADSSYGMFTIQDTSGLVLVSGSNAQTVSINQAIVSIVYNLTGSATNAVVSGLPAGVTAIVSGGTVTISGNPSVLGLATYGVLATGGTCPSGPTFGTINVQDTVVIIIDSFDTSGFVYVPNLFSPNDDGFNDTWNIDFPPTSTNNEVSVTIINREGQVVFSDNDYKNTWDGTHDGDALPEATYYYLILLKEADKTLKGPISILRNEK
jgi:gliding motility-associated-like protein